MLRCFATGLALTLTGCASAPAPIQTAAPVAVSVPCLGPEPAAPVLRFGLGPYPGDSEAIAAAWADIAALQTYADALKARAAGCLPAQ